MPYLHGSWTSPRIVTLKKCTPLPLHWNSTFISICKKMKLIFLPHINPYIGKQREVFPFQNLYHFHNSQKWSPNHVSNKILIMHTADSQLKIPVLHQKCCYPQFQVNPSVLKNKAGRVPEQGIWEPRHPRSLICH